MTRLEWRIRTGAGVGLVAVAAMVAGCAHRAAAPAAVATAPASRPASVGDGQRFAEPKDALDALVAACASGNESAVIAIFGQGARKLVSTGVPSSDAERCRRFVAAAKRVSRIDHAGPGAAKIVVGHDDWILPFPLVQTTSGWQFDIEAGRQEILHRRIGANELEAIRVCRAYAAAQQEYAATSGGRHAHRFVSTRGKRDGLHWPEGKGRDSSPLGPKVAAALQDGTWSGYRFRIVEPAGGGDDPSMVATPASYRESGAMSFLVTPDGRLLERDLGAGADPVAAARDAGNAAWAAVPR